MVNVKSISNTFDSGGLNGLIGSINTIALRTGFNTHFIDHNTICSSLNKYDTVFIKCIDHSYDSIISFMSLISHHNKIGFCFTLSKNIAKYLEYIKSMKPSLFLISESNLETPNTSSIVTSHNGIITCYLNIESDKIDVLSLNQHLLSNHVHFLEMPKSTLTIDKIDCLEGMLYLRINISFNYLESPNILIQGFQNKIIELIGNVKMKIKWNINYYPYYDTNLTASNIAKRAFFDTMGVIPKSVVDNRFSHFHYLSSSAPIIIINDINSPKRIDNIDKMAQIYFNIIHNSNMLEFR